MHATEINFENDIESKEESFAKTFERPSLWRKLVCQAKNLAKVIDDHFYEVEQFNKRLEDVKNEQLHKFWPYHMR